MSLVNTYYSATEPADTAPGTIWLRVNGTKAQRGLSGEWIEKGSWTEENDGMLSVNGGTVLGPVGGNHGHAPLENPQFTGTITCDGEEVPDKPWVLDQIQKVKDSITAFVNDIVNNTEGFTVENNLAIEVGVVAHDGIIPLPKYADGTRAVHEEIWAMLVTMKHAAHSTSDRAAQIGHYCSVDPATRKVTARFLMEAGGGGANWAGVGDANYIIICKR